MILLQRYEESRDLHLVSHMKTDIESEREGGCAVLGSLNQSLITAHFSVVI